MDKTNRSNARRRVLLASMVRALKAMILSSSEMILAVALVLVFAAAFLGILMLSFPKGTGLVSFYDDLVEQGAERSDLQLRSLSDHAPFVAVLQSVERRVRDRPADAFAWSTAHAGMQLEDHHTIQTLQDSAAAISFGERGRLRLGQRSLVVVKQDTGPTRRRPRTSVVLLGGRAQGELAAGKGRSPVMELVTPGGKSEMISRGAVDTEFSVKINSDESSTVSIHSGTVEITTADGSIDVGPKEAITYDASGMIGDVIRTPDQPKLLSPADGHVRTFSAARPRIELLWTEGEAADAYHLVLARDRELGSVVYEGELPRAGFVHGNLPAGRYYWSVSAISERAEGLASPVSSFRLVQDLTPPKLEVVLPEQVVGNRLVVRGTTEVGCELYVESEPVPLDGSGEFEYAITLKKGLNMVIVEAVDAAGNSLYRSQYVTARF